MNPIPQQQLHEDIVDAEARRPVTRTSEIEEEPPHSFSGHDLGILTLAYSPDSGFIASGSKDTTIRVWDAISGKQVGKPMEGHTNDVNAICWSPDGKFLVSGSDDGTMRIWEPPSESGDKAPPKTVETQSIIVTTVKYSPDGKLIASGGYDSAIKLWDANTHELVFEIKGPSEMIRQVAWAPDGERLATASNDGKICIFDVERRQLVMPPIEGHENWVNAVAYSPDGALLASASDDNSVRMWDAKSGAPVKSPFRGHSAWVSYVAWSPDSTRTVSGSHDNVVTMWDVAEGQPLFEVPRPEHRLRKGARAVAYAPDGKHFASASLEDDPRIRIWDAKTGAEYFPPAQDEEQSPSSHRSSSPVDKAKPQSAQDGVGQEKPQTTSRDKPTSLQRQISDDSIMNMPATISKNAQQKMKSENFWDGVDTEPTEEDQGTRTEDKGYEQKKLDSVVNKRHRIFYWLKRLWLRDDDDDGCDRRSDGAQRKSDDTGTQHEEPPSVLHHSQRREFLTGGKVKKLPWLRSRNEHRNTHLGSKNEQIYASEEPEKHRVRRRRFHRSTEIVSTARAKMRVFAAGDTPRRSTFPATEPESDDGTESPTEGSVCGSAESDSDGESDYGVIGTVCFCLCIPGCK